MTARRAGRRAVEWLVCRLGLHHASRWLHRRDLLIVCYHGVREDASSSAHWLLLPRRQLGEQLAYLARHYRSVSVDDAVEALRTGHLREPTVCITFDDGYASNRTIALPLLEALQLHATVYLTTGLIGTDRRLWSTALELAILQSSADGIDLSTLGGGRVALGDAPTRRRLASRVVEALKLRPVGEREAVLERLHAQLGAEPTGDGGAFAMMSWDDARSMASSELVSFGGHTINHDILSRVDDMRVAAEVDGSMRVVSERLGPKASRTFAFPNGREIDFDARAVAAVRRAGGTAAMSTREGLNTSDTDVFALRRIVIGPEMTMDAFRLQTSGAMASAKALMARLGMRRRQPAPMAPETASPPTLQERPEPVVG